MKRFNLWMLVAILSCGLLTTSCSEIDNPAPVRELSNSIDEFWDMPGNAGDPEVVAALQSIENVISWLTTTIPLRALSSSRWY